jgi:hypothetical protein
VPRDNVAWKVGKVCHGDRVARWFVFKPKHPIWGKFWGVLRWKIAVYFMTICSILRPLEIFNGYLVYFVVFGIFLPVLVFCTKKNLATLFVRSRSTFRPSDFLGILWNGSLGTTFYPTHLLYLLSLNKLIIFYFLLRSGVESDSGAEDPRSNPGRVQRVLEKP